MDLNHPSIDTWPSGLDATATGLFAILIVALPLAGYVFMVLDFRAYLHSLRRALVVVAGRFYDLPEWARTETPRSIAALGLRMPCSEEDLKRAYRKKVKQLHPDRGGDQRRFLALQAHFEEALRYLAQQQQNPPRHRPAAAEAASHSGG